MGYGQVVKASDFDSDIGGSNPPSPAIFFAGVAELADALDLGSSSSECRFDSCHPHHVIPHNAMLGLCFFILFKREGRMPMVFDIKEKEALEKAAAAWDVSASVHIEADAKTLYSAQHGYADREEGRPLSPSPSYALSPRTPFLLAVCALQLVEEGRLDLDAPIANYMPEYVHAKRMTTRQLFLHESGLPDYFYARKMLRLHADEKHKALDDESRFRVESEHLVRPTPFEDILALIGDDLEFKPGLRHDWSLTNLAFLEELMARVDGRNLVDCIAERVFSKAGVDVCRGFTANTVSYGVIRNTIRVRTPFPEDVEDVFTVTAKDMQKILAALMRDALFAPSSWEEALRLNDDGIAILADEDNGLFEFGWEVSGYMFGAYIDRDAKLFSFVLANEDETYKKKEGIWQCFSLDLQRIVERATTTPEKTRLEPYNKLNATGAIRLSIEKAQEEFVPDAKTALAFAYSRHETRKTYVLMEKSRAVGIVILTIDAKKNDYMVSIAIVDKAYQNRGFGKIMLRESLAILKDAGAKDIELFVLRHNVPAHRMYLSLGFKETAIYPSGYLLKKTL